jgi:hypothetical protein
MMVTRQPVSAMAFDVLWESSVPGQSKPAVLQGDSPGATVEERRQVVRDATAELRAKGYVGPRGAADEVAAVLATVGRPRLAVDVRLFERVPVTAGNPLGVARLGARVAVAGSRGAVAVLGPSWFTAWSFPDTSLVDEVIRLFGHHEPPARFAGLTLHPEQLRAPARKGGAESVLRLMEAPFLRRAYLCALTRDHVVGRTRVSPGLTLNDIEAGRFLVFTTRNQLVIAPGNRVTLERKLKEMTELHRAR